MLTVKWDSQQIDVTFLYVYPFVGDKIASYYGLSVVDPPTQ